MLWRVLQADAQRAKEIAEEAKETVVEVATHTKEVIEAKVRHRHAGLLNPELLLRLHVWRAGDVKNSAPKWPASVMRLVKWVSDCRRHVVLARALSRGCCKLGCAWTGHPDTG